MAEGVQAYLEKHKISSLFEDLMSKLVKDLPADPIEFLINKLQLLHRKKKTASPHSSPAITSRVRGRMQVTGTAVPSKTAAEKTTSSSVQRATRSIHSPSTHAKPSPTTKTHRAPSRPTTAGQPTRLYTPKATAASTAARKSKSAASPMTTRDSKRPTTAPGSAGRSPRAVPSEKIKNTPPMKVATRGTTTPSPSVTHDKAERKSEKQPEKVQVLETVPKETELDDFFGESRKSSSQQFLSLSDESEDIIISERTAELTDDEEESSGDRVMTSRGRKDEVDLKELLKRKQSSKGARKAAQQLKLHSLLPIDDQPLTSSGYVSGDEESEEGDTLEMVEDNSVLEEEGVMGLKKGRYVQRHGETDVAAVDLKVMICARCAKVLSQGDEEAEESVLQSVSATESEFESASQIAGQPSFPQWDLGSAVGSELSSVQKWMGSQAAGSTLSHDSGSDVTLQSHDTWGGLAPRVRAPVILSDEESEVQLPPPPPLEGRPWSGGSPAQHDPHGWAGQDPES